MTAAHLLVLAALCAPLAAKPGASRQPLEPGPALADLLGARFPDPVLTEVLYAVPTAEGDASGDGSRDAVGDEFVELFNPHDQPINLRGYTLTDRNPAGMGQVKFVFPALELPPGGIALVFNGKDQRFRGPVGDQHRPPPASHPGFGGAWVFTLANTDRHTGFGNDGDWVLLSDPSGRPIECLRWGELEDSPPIPRDRLATSPTIFRGSVTRDASGAWVEHRSLTGVAFSPGVWPGVWLAASGSGSGSEAEPKSAGP